MSLREFANICFPTQVLTINECDSLVSLIISLMIFMCIKPSCWCSIHFLGLALVFGLSFVDRMLVTWIGLYVLFFNWLCSYLILRSDHSNLYSIWLCLDWHGLFHFVVCFLLSIETNDFVLRHTVLFFTNSGDCLNETDHSLITLRIEFAVVTSFDWFELIRAIFLG